MKMHIALLASALLMLSSCASVVTISQSASNQRFDDGIYYNPETKLKEIRIESTKEVSALAQKTKSSSIFKASPKLDTLVVKDPVQVNNVVFAFDPFYSWVYTGAFAFSLWARPWYGFYPLGYDYWYWNRWTWYDPFWDPFWHPGWGLYSFNWNYHWGHWGPWGPGWGPGYVYVDPTPRAWKSPSSRPNFRSQNRPGFRAGGGSGGGLGISGNRIAAPVGKDISPSGSTVKGLVRSANTGGTSGRLVSERSIITPTPGLTPSGGNSSASSNPRTVNRTTINGTMSGNRTASGQTSASVANRSNASVSTANRPAVSRSSAASSSASRPVASARPAGSQAVSRTTGISRTTVNSTNGVRSGSVPSYGGQRSTSTQSAPQRSSYGGGYSGGGASRSSGSFGGGGGGGVSRTPSGGGGGGFSRSPR
ncbi:MAG: hypothetical protein MJY80_06470 [Bacteroidales bacterium]|nr:hypothetical protein [Bacteroidales bacterium]